MKTPIRIFPALKLIHTLTIHILHIAQTFLLFIPIATCSISDCFEGTCVVFVHLLGECKFINLMKVQKRFHVFLLNPKELQNISCPINLFFHNLLEKQLNLLNYLLCAGVEYLRHIDIPSLSTLLNWILFLLLLLNLVLSFFVNDWIYRLHLS